MSKQLGEETHMSRPTEAHSQCHRAHRPRSSPGTLTWRQADLKGPKRRPEEARPVDGGEDAAHLGGVAALLEAGHVAEGLGDRVKEKVVPVGAGGNRRGRRDGRAARVGRIGRTKVETTWGGEEGLGLEGG